MNVGIQSKLFLQSCVESVFVYLVQSCINKETFLIQVCSNKRTLQVREAVKMYFFYYEGFAVFYFSALSPLID